MLIKGVLCGVELNLCVPSHDSPPSVFRFASTPQCPTTELTTTQQQSPAYSQKLTQKPVYSPVPFLRDALTLLPQLVPPLAAEG